jgi:hypothetical protein
MSGAWEQQNGLDYFIGLASLGPTNMTWAITFKELIIPGSYTVGSWLGLPVDAARDRLVKDAQEAGARYLFFLDDDVMPPADTLAVLQGNELPIVSGLYWAKRGMPAIWRWNKADKDYQPIRQWPQNALLPIDAAGAGCLLIDMRVFDRIPEPWFLWEVRDPRKPKGRSEDFYFFKKAQEHGFACYCDTRVRCIHQAHSELMPEGTFRLAP